MMMKWTHALAVGLLAIGLAACQKHTQVQPESKPAPSSESTGAETSGLPATSAPSTTGNGMSEAQQQALSALQARGNIVYFNFDSSEIRSEDLALVAAHASYLAKYKNAKVRLEGHTDERGSPEYNVGLGERRAQTVRKALMLQGVTDPQITTVSYGEERPAVEGSDEAAYAKNRRVELVELP